MEIHTRSKSSLFLTEMIISVLFFSIAAACCIQIFVRAHFVSQNSENLIYAQNLASGMAESMMASDGEYSEIRQYFPTADINGNTITVYYDKHWSACEKENAIYILRTTFEQAPDTLSGRILVSGPLKSPDAKGEIIFTLPFRQHISRFMTKEH